MPRTLLPSLIVLSALLFGLTACAPPPIYKPVAGTLMATPTQVSQTPEQFNHGRVIWGGSIVRVRNLPDQSEIEILAYPLDSSQRPLFRSGASGRFIAIVPGYVESMNYPSGMPITVDGQLAGTRVGPVGQASYVFPLVKAAQWHAWTLDEMRSGHPSFSFGVGVGAGFR